MHIFVTGSSGYLGRLAIPALLASSEAVTVTGVDVTAPPAELSSHPRFRALKADLARPADWESALAEADAVVHLAFQMSVKPGEDPHAVDLTVQERFLEAAASRARPVVVASAIAVYGFAPGRDPHSSVLDETAPRVPLREIAYADQKQRLETFLDGLESRSPARLVRARITNVAGAGIDRRRAPQLSGAIMVAPATAHPLRQQLIHESDFASAVLALLEAPSGAYNVGPDDWLTMEDAARMNGQRYMPLPGWMLRPLAEMAWRTGSTVFDPSWLAFLENPPIIVSNAKLRALGWSPRYTTADTLREVAQAMRGALR
jgi:nucleoside-diphosphate-sugar epimerase